MVDQDFVELMHYEIDGVIAAEDRDRLQRYLEANPEAKTFHDELKSVSATLQRVESIEPPPALRGNILNSLPKNLYVENRPQERSAGWLDFLQRKPKLGFSLSFAVGLACGLVWLALPLELADISNSDLIGTMQTIDSSQNLQHLSSLDIMEDNFSMTIELKRSGEFVFVAMHVRSVEELEFALEFDQSDLQFSGFQTKEPSKNKLNLDLARVSVRHQGEGRLVLAFTDKTSSATSIALRLYNPELIYENSFNSGSN